jgi:hypothetical protein
MGEYLVELYLSRADRPRLERDARSAHAAAAALTLEGTPVRYLSSIFVPEDETCFYLYEAASVDGVRQAACRADLPFERITPVLAAATDRKDRP